MGYLKDISQGKAMDIPESRQHMDQKSCRYVPHIMLVPQGDDLQIKRMIHPAHGSHVWGSRQ